MPFNGYLTSYPYSIDELERSRPKDALSEVEKYKKRYPKQANTPIIGALKCVALQRLGRDDEAYETFLTMVKANRKVKNGSQNTSEQIEEIPSDVVIDENALHTLGYALRPMRKRLYRFFTGSGRTLTRPLSAVPQLMKLYENAWVADPENLELGVQVFQHAVRIHDWRTTQQVSRTAWLKSVDLIVCNDRLPSSSSVQAKIQELLTGQQCRAISRYVYHLRSAHTCSSLVH
jgi:tetratricopeptide (TPR) repeat protein